MSRYYRIDFQFANNEDLRQTFAVSDAAATPLDLTGANLKMDIQTQAGSRVLEVSLANGRIAISNAAQGRFTLAIPAAIMRTLPAGSYRHDLLLVRGAETKRVWEGFLTINTGVTA